MLTRVVEVEMAGRSGFGSTRKLPSGRWQARYTGPDALVYAGPTTFQTKGDAQAWLANESRLISLEQWSSPDGRAIQVAAAVEARRSRTFAVYAEQWLASRRPQGQRDLPPYVPLSRPRARRGTLSNGNGRRQTRGDCFKSCHPDQATEGVS